MKISDMEYTYCLGSYEKAQCVKCKRNIQLYEDENIQLYWTDSYKIRNSRTKICPEYKKLDNVK